MTTDLAKRLESLAAAGVVEQPIEVIYPSTDKSIADSLWLAACVEAIDRWAAHQEDSREYELLVDDGPVYLTRLFGDKMAHEARGSSRLESLVAALEALP